MWKQLTFLAILLTCFAANVNAEAYKWTDKNGNIIYSQTPPPLGTPYELVDAATIASTSFGVANDSTTKIEKQLNESQAAREEKKNQEKLIAESEQIRQQNCKQANTNLTGLTSRGQVTIKENGLYRKLTEEERQERIQQAKQSIEEFCN